MNPFFKSVYHKYHRLDIISESGCILVHIKSHLLWLQPTRFETLNDAQVTYFELNMRKEKFFSLYKPLDQNNQYLSNNLLSKY